MSNCEIFLNNNHFLLTAGQPIEGRVVFTHPQTIHIKEVTIKIEGNEHTEWAKKKTITTGQGRYIQTKQISIPFRADNQILAIEASLCGPGYCKNLRNEYPFSIALPPHIPGSYKGKYGWIKYKLTAVVDITGIVGENCVDIKSVQVHAPYDLNKIHNFKLGPHKYRDETLVNNTCWGKEPASMDVFFEKKAFAEQEKARIKVVLTNDANRNIDTVSVQLRSVLTSKSLADTEAEKREETILATESSTGVGAHGTRSILFLLPCPQSHKIFNFEFSKLFSQMGYVTIEAYISDQVLLQIEAKVHLGHIPVDGPEEMRSLFPPPIRQPIVPAPRVAQVNPLPSAPPLEIGWPSAPPDGFVPDATDAPPPSYEEVTRK